MFYTVQCFFHEKKKWWEENKWVIKYLLCSYHSGRAILFYILLQGSNIFCYFSDFEETEAQANLQSEGWNGNYSVTMGMSQSRGLISNYLIVDPVLFLVS